MGRLGDETPTDPCSRWGYVGRDLYLWYGSGPVSGEVSGLDLSTAGYKSSVVWSIQCKVVIIASSDIIAT